MGRKKPSWYAQNLPKLAKLCDELGLEWEFKDPDEYQVRVYGATHIIDIWPSRMVYHRVNGENINANEKYHHLLDEQFNYRQVKRLLLTGLTDGLDKL